MQVEHLILKNLLANEEYTRRVLPYIKPEYFHNKVDKVVLDLISDYTNKYNKVPTKDALLVDIGSLSGLHAEEYTAGVALINELSARGDDLPADIEWVLTTTEKFCQDKAIYNGIMDAIKILDDKDSSISKGGIPKILSDALGVNFDTHIGHDFIEDSNARFEFYNRKVSKIPFDLEYFNKITGGGLPNKTLSVCLAGTGAGKSLFMCHCAAANLMDHRNVLYITLELAEERVAERIDANLLDIPISELASIDKTRYDAKMAHVKSKSKGKLVVKEYPTASAGAGHFRHLLNELKLKKNFKPDIIYIDYMNICTSSRIKAGANVNSYTMVKAIAEELRGLAVEFEVPIVTATQSTRSGYSNSDVGLEDVSESFGTAHTADFMFALITTDELAGLNQLLVKQLKNRFSDPDQFKRFVVGIDKSRMRLYDVEQNAQSDLIDTPLMDNTGFGTRDSNESKFKSKFTNFS
jgi:archaellum biogenesis ATPase FlaH